MLTICYVIAGLSLFFTVLFIAAKQKKGWIILGIVSTVAWGGFAYMIDSAPAPKTNSSGNVSQEKTALAKIEDKAKQSKLSTADKKKIFNKIQLGTSIKDVQEAMKSKGKVTVDKTTTDIDGKKLHIIDLTIYDDFSFMFFNNKLEEKTYIK